MNAARPITVTTPFVVLIQSIRGEDAPKTQRKGGEKKPQPVLPRSCAPLFESRMCWNALCLFLLAPLNGVLFFFFLQYFTPRYLSGREVRLAKQLLGLDQHQLTSWRTMGPGSPGSDPHNCSVPSPRTAPLQLKCPTRGGQSFSSLMGNVATSHHVNVQPFFL